MGLDIRLPIGYLFAILGVMLVVYGLVTETAIYDRSLGINVNLWWGICLVAFGGVMLLLGRRGARTMTPAEQSPEGRQIEIDELRSGKESRNPMSH